MATAWKQFWWNAATQPRSRRIFAIAVFVCIYFSCWYHTANHESRILPGPFDWAILKTWFPAPFVIINDEVEIKHSTSEERRVYILSFADVKHLIDRSTITVSARDIEEYIDAPPFLPEKHIEAVRKLSEAKQQSSIRIRK